MTASEQRLPGVSGPRQGGEDTQADEYAAPEAPAKASDTTSARQRRRNRSRRQGIGAVGGGGDGHEERAERHGLKHGRHPRTQELGQECGEEDRGLGIEQRDDEAVAEDAAEGGVPIQCGRRLVLRTTQHPDPEIHERTGTGFLNNHARRRRYSKQRREAKRRGQRVAQVAKGDARHRHQPRAAALGQAPRHDVEDPGAGRHRQHQAREQEGGEQRPGRKQFGHG